MEEEQSFPLREALRQRSVRALEETRWNLLIAAWILASGMAGIGLYFVVTLATSGRWNGPINVVFWSVSGIALVAGSLICINIVRTLPSSGLPIELVLTSAAIQLVFPEGRTESIAWSDPQFAIQIREDRDRKRPDEPPVLWLACRSFSTAAAITYDARTAIERESVRRGLVRRTSGPDGPSGILADIRAA